MNSKSEFILVVLACALVLRLIASSLHSQNSLDVPDPAVLQETALLVEERDSLQRDIAQIQRALDHSTQSHSSPPLVPPPSQPVTTYSSPLPPSSHSTLAVHSITSPDPLPARPPAAEAVMPPAVTPPAPGELVWFYDGEQLPHRFVDFPCALKNFRQAKVTTNCEIDCLDAQCTHAKEVCDRYVECNAIQLKASRGENLSSKSAVLKHDSQGAVDNSMSIIHSSVWWKSHIGLTNEVKPRTYVVASYGGCGSKMLAGWLSQLPGKHKVSVFHYHDRHPPKQLRAFGKAPAPDIKRDYRTGRFRGGGTFPSDSNVVSDADLDSYRIIYLYKDPVEALVSRYGYGHCQHIQGNCGPSEASWPRLDAYAKSKNDRMGLIEYFNSYMHPDTPRQYPIVALNYHKLWDNLPAVMEGLGLPQSLEGSFPPRTETVRNDMTGKSERNAAHTETTRNGLREMYSAINKEISANPAVMVV